MFIQPKPNVKTRDGEIHQSVNFYLADMALALGLVLFTFGFGWDFWITLERLGCFWLGAKLASFYMTPDLDLYRSTPKKHWGGLAFVWEPYRTFIAKKHRDTWSHGITVPRGYRGIKYWLFRYFGWMLGSLARLVYLTVIIMLPVFAVAYIYNHTVFIELGLRLLVHWRTAWFVGGVMFADWLHVKVVDSMPKGSKKGL